MSPSCSKHRRFEPPVVTRDEALRGLEIATAFGTEAMLAVACIDADRHPIVMLMIDDCPAGADEVLAVVEMVARIERRGRTFLDSVAIGVSRPAAPAVTPADQAMWPRIVAICSDVGVSVLDWWVLSDGTATSVAREL